MVMMRPTITDIGLIDVVATVSTPMAVSQYDIGKTSIVIMVLMMISMVVMMVMMMVATKQIKKSACGNEGNPCDKEPNNESTCGHATNEESACGNEGKRLRQRNK